MGRRVPIPEAAKLTGLSQYAIRKGIRERRYPHIRTGLGSGRIIVDIDLLEKYLEQEANDNASAERIPGGQNLIDYGRLRRVVE